LLLCSDVDLPEDAFTDDIKARLDNHKLQVRIARRDPEGPAMQVCETKHIPTWISAFAMRSA
jgi:HSP20 family molecular chaperone IbpA